MKRSNFIRISALSGIGLTVGNLSTLAKTLGRLPNSEQIMPVLFMGHGSPMNAIEENEYTKNWPTFVKGIPKPKAILCISAHWETIGSKVTAMEKPRMIYDMYGFPAELYKVQYNCPGAPGYAKEVQETVQGSTIVADHEWGLDHGTWSILLKMYPRADIPTFQLSLDKNKTPDEHYALGKELSALRKKGVLIVGSGNIVHNLRMAKFGNDIKPYDWALEFDETSKKLMLEGNHQALIHYEKLGKAAQLSINSAEHYVPLLYTLALQQDQEAIMFTNEGIAFGSGSMRCVKIG